MMKISMSTAGACAIFSCAGTTLAATDTTPMLAEPSRGTVVNTAHIYYNAVTGERLVTLLADSHTAPADTQASFPIWSTLVQNPCADQGYVTEYYFGFENPGSTSLSTAITLLDYGDITLDTVVDCIQVNWVTAHADRDENSDGVGDGVEELAGQWIVWDADNGRQLQSCMRSPLIDFLITNLPGNTPDNTSQGVLTGYTMDIDLIGGFSGSNLSFEIGDSDGSCQTAAFCNNDIDTNSDGIGDGVSIANADQDFDGLPDSDLDGDGLFDWSWTVRFYQPGMGNDFDSDSDTGVSFGSASDTIGVSFGFPAGEAVENNDGTWTWQIDTLVAASGTGEEDRFVIMSPPSSTGGITYNGGYWFGGFACTGGLQSTGGTGYTPPAMFQFVLYSPGVCLSCCPAELNGDGVVDFFDISYFIQAFNAQDPLADFNGDGNFNFFDVSLFIQAFNAGCP